MEGLTEFVSKSFVKDSVTNLSESLGSLPCKVEEEFDSSPEPTDLRIRKRSESPEIRSSKNDDPQQPSSPPKTETIDCSEDSDNGRWILSLFSFYLQYRLWNRKKFLPFFSTLPEIQLNIQQKTTLSYRRCLVVVIFIISHEIYILFNFYFHFFNYVFFFVFWSVLLFINFCRKVYIYTCILAIIFNNSSSNIVQWHLFSK